MPKTDTRYIPFQDALLDRFEKIVARNKLDQLEVDENCFIKPPEDKMSDLEHYASYIEKSARATSANSITGVVDYFGLKSVRLKFADYYASYFGSRENTNNYAKCYPGVKEVINEILSQLSSKCDKEEVLSYLNNDAGKKPNYFDDNEESDWDFKERSENTEYLRHILVEELNFHQNYNGGSSPKSRVPVVLAAALLGSHSVLFPTLFPDFTEKLAKFRKEISSQTIFDNIIYSQLINALEFSILGSRLFANDCKFAYQLSKSFIAQLNAQKNYVIIDKYRKGYLDHEVEERTWFESGKIACKSLLIGAMYGIYGYTRITANRYASLDDCYNSFNNITRGKIPGFILESGKKLLMSPSQVIMSGVTSLFEGAANAFHAFSITGSLSKSFIYGIKNFFRTYVAYASFYACQNFISPFLLPISISLTLYAMAQNYYAASRNGYASLNQQSLFGDNFEAFIGGWIYTGMALLAPYYLLEIPLWYISQEFYSQFIVGSEIDMLDQQSIMRVYQPKQAVLDKVAKIRADIIEELSCWVKDGVITKETIIRPNITDEHIEELRECYNTKMQVDGEFIIRSNELSQYADELLRANFTDEEKMQILSLAYRRDMLKHLITEKDITLTPAINKEIAMEMMGKFKQLDIPMNLASKCIREVFDKLSEEEMNAIMKVKEERQKELLLSNQAKQLNDDIDTSIPHVNDDNIYPAHSNVFDEIVFDKQRGVS